MPKSPISTSEIQACAGGDQPSHWFIQPGSSPTDAPFRAGDLEQVERITFYFSSGLPAPTKCGQLPRTDPSATGGSPSISQERSTFWPDCWGNFLHQVAFGLGEFHMSFDLNHFWNFSSILFAAFSTNQLLCIFIWVSSGISHLGMFIPNLDTDLKACSNRVFSATVECKS